MRKVFSPTLVCSLCNSTKSIIYKFEHVTVLESTKTSSFIKASHLNYSKQLEILRMEESNAIWLSYLLGGLLTLIEDLGAPLLCIP
jgi:hypothetical protein|uniref:Uncharacterized protein n=1 Tax=Picea glauca TaxID=3330 RepID=A0A101M1W3_PICGL|nr:hypothetical protein ABT39_MTgene2751 [Picea glauca]